MPEKAHYIGHRKRLRERFAKSGADGLADYELVELLLFSALPRSDAKPLAKRLCDRFGSISAILAADPRLWPKWRAPAGRLFIRLNWPRRSRSGHSATKWSSGR